MKFVQLLVFIMLIVYCVNSASNFSTINLRDRISLSVALDQDNITYTVVAPKGHWVGFGYGPSMTRAEMFLLETVHGEPRVTDLWSKKAKRPKSKDHNNYKIIDYYHDGEYYVYKVSCTKIKSNNYLINIDNTCFISYTITS